MALVDAAWLAEHLHDPDVRVCDVRWYLSKDKRGIDAYRAGHVPGAAFIDLDGELASPDDGRAGRHPLPAAETFVAAMRRAGIGPNTHVVAYDDGGGSVAARLWWLLRAYGHAKVSLLDGGIQAWTKAGGALETTTPTFPEGSFSGRFDAQAALSIDETRHLVSRGGLLLDARAPERYRGEVEPVDARPGHVPGAVNVPFATLLEEGRFLPHDRLASRLETLRLDERPVVASCGSGVTACLLLFALDHAGVVPFPAARLYAGSYSEWARRKDLPVATGASPGEPA